MSKSWNALALSHDFLRRHVPLGGTVIDATAGNGLDTLFLCDLVGKDGKVLAFDIQPQAVERTRALLAREGRQNAAVLLEGHENMAAYGEKESVDAVAFNFGWLPGGDHGIFTRAGTSVPAVCAGLELLKPGGVMSLCLYYGRDNGYEERDALLRLVSSLDDRRFTVMVIDFANRKNDPPMAVWIVKEG